VKQIATGRRPDPKKRQRTIPGWMMIVLAVLCLVVVYGAFAPSPPSAFDRPEAQTNPTRPPWDQPRSF
jgi:hypothetical protein